MNRRTGKDIWTGLYEFPIDRDGSCDGFSGLCETQAFRNLLGDAEIEYHPWLSNVKHTLSHQILYASFYQPERAGLRESLGNYLSCLVGILRSMLFPG